VVSRLVAIETDDSRDETYPVGGLRITLEEIVLGQTTDHSIAAKQQGQRLDDRGLATVVRADEHGVCAEPDVTGSDATKVLDAQIGYRHGIHLPWPP